jgi:Flp pilus assembly protein TadG
VIEIAWRRPIRREIGLSMRRLKDESGQTLVVFAAFMGLIALGFLAMALDAGLLFHRQRMAQAAADAAAVAAATELSNGGTTAQQQTAANAIATLNGMSTTLAANPAQVTLTPNPAGNFTGASYVQATVTQPIHTYFLGAFNHGDLTVSVSATAIAGGAASSTCICLEGTTGEDLNLSNNSKLSSPSCGVVDNSASSNAVGVVGSASLNASTLGTVSSTWDNSSNINNAGTISSSTKITMGLTSGCAPSMPAAPSYGTCLGDPGGSYMPPPVTFGPSVAGGTICYTSLTIGANGVEPTLTPGIYVISTGNLHFESGANGYSNQGGNGVFFYILAGTLAIDNGAKVNLVAGGNTESGGATAPGTGAYNGILVYQPKTNTTAMTVAGGSNAYINGGLYAPGANMTLNNGSGTTVYGNVVAQSLTMAGGATLSTVPATVSAANTTPKLVQ